MLQSISTEVENNFNKALQAAIDTGQAPGSNEGFNQEVFLSLMNVADEYPSVTPQSIQNAKQMWRRWASGADAINAQAEIAAVITRHGWK